MMFIPKGQCIQIKVLIKLSLNPYVIRQIQYIVRSLTYMSQKRTLEKCKRIMQMFDKQKSKPTSALKEKPLCTNSTYLSNKNNKSSVNNRNRVSFCLPAKPKERSHSKHSLKPSINKSSSSIHSAQKSIQSHSASKSASKNFSSIYNTQSRYQKIMNLKVKSNFKPKQNNRVSYLNTSKISFRSSGSSVDRSKSRESRLDRIMKLKVHKPKVDSTLKHYQPSKQQRKIIHKENLDQNSVIQLKKCKQKIKKEIKQADKEDRLWKVFERERDLRLKQKQKKQRVSYQRQQSLEKRFDALVQKELKRIQMQKQLEERREEGFSTYLFPSY